MLGDIDTRPCLRGKMTKYTPLVVYCCPLLLASTVTFPSARPGSLHSIDVDDRHKPRIE